jgi:hypothetical protein
MPTPNNVRRTPAVPPPVAGKVDALWFRNDHHQENPSDPNVKLLRPSPSSGSFADAKERFSKPEWTAGDNGARVPASYTMGTEIVVDLRLQFTMTPSSRKAQLTKIRGAGVSDTFNYERTFDPPETITQGAKDIWWLRPKDTITRHVVTMRGQTIAWYATVDGVEIYLGVTGPHKIYVTYARPHGNMSWHPFDRPLQIGPDQDVTEERLELAISYAKRASDEKAVVDAVADSMKFQHYRLGKTWLSYVPAGLGFHQYMWQMVKGTAQGECIQLAAAFILACEILGVGQLELGAIFPAGRRDPNTGKPRPNPKHGFYNRIEVREHAYHQHGKENLAFRDSSGGVNNFEGVAKYQDRFLYGIGEPIPKGTSADEVADLYYQASFLLLFSRDDNTHCDDAYPGELDHELFYWTD